MRFSKHIFWDADPVALDIQQHRKYVIGRVPEYGTLDDWRLLLALFGLGCIVEVAQSLRELEPKALTFLCAVGEVPKESFRCYTSRQSNPTLWNS